jgi:CAAX amino terminal protease family.
MWNENEKRPVGQYLALVFLIAWASEAILILLEQFGIMTGTVPGTVGFFVTYAVIGFGAGFAPAYAIYILLKKHKQINGLKDFFRLYFKTNNVLKTVFITIAFFCALLLVNIIGNKYLGNPWYLFLLLIPIMMIGGGMEEPGWRGFLQPSLEKRFPFPIATLIMGVIWAVWHLPLWLVKGASQSSVNFFLFLVFCIIFSFALAALYKLTRCVFACSLLHAWSNVLSAMFILYSTDIRLDSRLIVMSLLEVIAAIVIWTLADRKEKAPKKEKSSQIC